MIMRACLATKSDIVGGRGGGGKRPVADLANHQAGQLITEGWPYEQLTLAWAGQQSHFMQAKSPPPPPPDPSFCLGLRPRLSCQDPLKESLVLEHTHVVTLGMSLEATCRIPLLGCRAVSQLVNAGHADLAALYSVSKGPLLNSGCYAMLGRSFREIR